MSMFYELMMRKKTEYLYPVIKGSLTDTDGIISGFVNTGANYLQVNNMDSLALADTWEIILKVENLSGSYILGSNKERIITISLSTGKIYLSSDGSTWNIASGVGGGSVPANSYVRVKFTGTQYTFDYSSDKINWINCATVTSSTKISNSLTYLRIGSWWTGGSGYTSNFSGSIDLNNSYIKIGTTKYNLQAVVGYTIVGSPTITDGVLINPTDKQNTIKIETNYEGTINKFEMMMKVLPTQVAIGLFRFNSSNNSRATIGNTGQIRLYPNYPLSSTDRFDTTQALWNSAISDNVPLYVRFIYEVINNEYKYYCDFSFDKITWVKNETTLSVPLVNTLIEFFSSYNSYSTGHSSNCDLYLNETYIKINNKLWFNGQEG